MVNKSINMDESQMLMNDLYERGKVISTGKFLKSYSKEKSLQVSISFVSGTAYPLNYMIIRAVCSEIRANCYLEIGSYTGESIYNVKDICEKCISITAPLDSEYSMASYCEKFGFHDFSNRLVDTNAVQQHFANSQEFDFGQITERPDVVLIDGEDSYQGVYNDTVNIKKICKEDTIIIWQCVKRNPSSSRQRNNVIKAVRDALTQEEYERVYIFDHGTFGIYIPDKYAEIFEDCLDYDKETLYVYKLNVEVLEK